ncbi:MAG: Rieske (2Fe-2S) iron-sulfur domain protein [Anaerolineaceae bacterium]|nr:MAG: Rieske (2Fe-2S) iron-sulfur domain protein [Anaerolineaceae bacterium]
MSDITRRDFLKLLQGAGVLLGISVVAAPVAAYFYPSKLIEMPSEPVLVCPESELPVGQAKTVEFGRYPALVINTEDGLKAYSAVCTHFACLVKWNPDSGQIECPCHDGFFKVADGSVIAGPPPKPLLTLATQVVDGQIYVKVGGGA